MTVTIPQPTTPTKPTPIEPAMDVRNARTRIVASGVKAYATLVMWATYVILAIYFYIQWHKEIKTEKKQIQ